MQRNDWIETARKNGVHLYYDYTPFGTHNPVAKRRIKLNNELERHEVFEKELLEKLYQFFDEEEISVKFVEEEERAVRGATLIAVQGAIERLRI